jgi:hypothetical protein
VSSYRAEGYFLLDPQGGPVDVYRTRSGADHAATLLNTGGRLLDADAPARRRVIPAPMILREAGSGRQDRLEEP